MVIYCVRAILHHYVALWGQYNFDLAYLRAKEHDLSAARWNMFVKKVTISALNKDYFTKHCGVLASENTLKLCGLVACGIFYNLIMCAQGRVTLASRFEFSWFVGTGYLLAVMLDVYKKPNNTTWRTNIYNPG